MKTALLCIGDELLKGSVLNTNLAFLGEILLKNGILPECSIEIPDRAESIRSALDYAFSLASVVITSGGLGPTADDITKETIADYFGVPLENDLELENHLKESWARTHQTPLPYHWLRQSMVPRGAVILPNKVGSAPGLLLKKEGRTLFMLPGPPVEQAPMLLESVIPRLTAALDEPLYSALLHVVGIGESAVEEKVKPILHDGLSAAYCASPGHVKLYFTSRTESVIREAVKESNRIFAGDILTTGAQNLAEEVLNLLGEKKLMLATAESCTGGLISGALTAIPGSSNVFLGGAATYSNELKMKFLGVREETLAQFGAVSMPCAKEMADGICARTGADAGISVTGIAGPGGGTPEKPVGLVYIGASLSGKTIVKECRFHGGRDRVRASAVSFALNLLRKMLIGKEME